MIKLLESKALIVGAGAGLSASLAEGLRIEQDLFVESFRTEDSQIGIKSFLEHGPGKAQFTGT